MKTLKASMLGLLLSATAFLGQAVAASDNVVRIGMLDDESSVYSSLGGEGSIIAIQMAIEDHGGKALGNPIEFKYADHLNKPDNALSLANDWLQNQKFDLILGGGSSAPLLAIQSAMKSMPDKALIVTGASSMDFAGKNCTPNSMHFAPNNYALLAPTAKSLIDQGDKNWYFLSSDNAGGKIALDTAAKMLEENGGKKIGESLFPLESTDFSSYLLQAQSAQPQVLALATSGSPLIAIVKQSAEFGIRASNIKMVLLAAFITDINSLGLQDTQGLSFSTTFYWDLNESTRAWSKRFFEKHKAMPTDMQAAAYIAVTHYLQAVDQAKTDDASVVVPLMKKTPVKNALVENGQVRQDGMFVRPTYFVQVKSPAESKYPWDYYKILQTVPADQGFLSTEKQGCKLGQ